MKTIQVKTRINNFEGYTYKPGQYEVIKDGSPMGFQVAEEAARKLLKRFPDSVAVVKEEKAGK